MSENNPATSERSSKRLAKAERRKINFAAIIAGEDSSTWSDEAKMIEKIVNDVSNKLISTSSTDFADFVGIEDHIKNMNSLLDLESEEVIMVGVWGPSGVGYSKCFGHIFELI